MNTDSNAIPEKRRTVTDSFQSNEMSLLSALSFNELGYRESAKAAWEYVARAISALAEAEELDRKTKKAARELRERAEKLKEDCRYMETFQRNRDEFRGKNTEWAIEWTSKQAVRALARGHISQFHNLLAHKIRRFHAEVSAILNEAMDPRLSFMGK